MGQCSGCSRIFRNLTKDRCESCLQSTPRAKNKMPSCAGCGKVYEFLATEECQPCTGMLIVLFPTGTSADVLFNLDASDNEKAEDRSATQNAVRHAMNHPVDPRTYGRREQEHPYNRNPHVSAAQISQPRLMGPQWDEVNHNSDSNHVSISNII